MLHTFPSICLIFKGLLTKKTVCIIAYPKNRSLFKQCVMRINDGFSAEKGKRFQVSHIKTKNGILLRTTCPHRLVSGFVSDRD